MAHRGGIWENVENSIDGVDAAVKNKWGLEMDIQKTKDGKYILCHDSYLLRITG